MSQPPPPPSPPPGQPGYGYPSAPQPPGPYGPVPPGQPVPPPFGQVPGGYTTPPPGGPSGGNRTGVVVAVVSAVVALAVLAGGLVYILSGNPGDDVADGGTTHGTTGGGGGGGTGTQARQLFALQAPGVSDVTDVEGAWATKDVFAKGTVGGVVGVDATSGKQRWKLPLDGEICAASRQLTADDVTAVISEDGSADGSCSQLVLFNVETGKKIWQKTMPGSDSAGALGMNVTLSGGTVAAAWIGGAVGYRLTGEGVWKADPDKPCRDRGYAGGEKLVALVECEGHDGVAVQTVDPTNGDGGKAYQVPGGDEFVQVASTDPLVLVADDGDRVLAVEDGKLTGQIDTKDRYDVGCRSDTVEGCYNIAAGPGALYLQSKRHTGDGDYRDTDEVVAFDLTGKKLWETSGGKGRMLQPLRVAGGRVVAYRPQTFEAGGAIVTLDAQTGEARTEMTMPKSDPADTLVPGELMERALYAGGRFYLQQHLIAGHDKEYLAVGFGPK